MNKPLSLRTPQEAFKDAKASGAIDAWERGESIQYKHSLVGDWKDAIPGNCPNFASVECIWRPTPKDDVILVPWKEADIPVGALFRFKKNPVERSMIIGSTSDNELQIPGLAEIRIVSALEALRYGEYSLDGGRTWSPCGIKVDEPPVPSESTTS